MNYVTSFANKPDNRDKKNWKNSYIFPNYNLNLISFKIKYLFLGFERETTP